ncbi:unnamed protein product [Spirodela intermedia]|uniref:Lunapark zinc ribbon domain-containing protein n=1 Tax=Spirodela intermedia TaxID=51605 RepID=A0A7I8IEG9_SPIIN|nr:unnamed protein product [Spirodela intermedia]CAA6655784.1 unnamed protein product [Spirodela intermedia]
MAEDGKEESAAVVDSSGEKLPQTSDPKKRKGSCEDYEKRLEYLSKEEASVHVRLKRRAQRWRKTVRNIIVFSVVLEVIAVAYAVLTTRSVDLSWQMRALRVLPMFALPTLSSAVYSILVSLTRMLDHRDQKALERLRAERKAKIDELKERTNYYTTQQLIQRYDLDPAAKAAAAAVLASKLGADTGMKFFVGEESNSNNSSGKSSHVELVKSDGLRNRKHPHRNKSAESDKIQTQLIDEISPDQEVPAQTRKVVEHDKNPRSDDGGWISRIAALLVGDDPTQCYAVICVNCRMHNGLARKDDFPYITYYCPHCDALNGPRQSEELASGPSSEKTGPRTTALDYVSNTNSVLEEAEITSSSVTPVEAMVGGKEEDPPNLQAAD